MNYLKHQRQLIKFKFARAHTTHADSERIHTHAACTTLVNNNNNEFENISGNELKRIKSDKPAMPGYK